MEKKRDNFSSKFAFVLACIGSAVGMGNIWLFPYRVGQFGGFAFLIPYIFFVIILGFTGVVGEIAFGRYMQNGPLKAFDKALKTRNKKGGMLLSLIPILGSLAIAIGYSVVVAWILKYLFLSLSGSVNLNFDSMTTFSNLALKFGSINYHIIVMLLVFAVMSFKISKGIEKLNKFLMPLFFLLFLMLSIRVMFLNGSMKGYMFLLYPNFSALLNIKTWVYALGQAFFSLSIAGSGTLVYGSYLKKDVDIIDAAVNIALFDTIAAILSCFVILPAVFAFKFKVSAGPALMFMVMPEIFKNMPLSSLMSSIFFIAVFFAGITSLVNLFETPIEAIESKFKIKRAYSVLLTVVIAFIIGIFIEDGNILSTWMDFVSIYIIPLGAFLAALMFYWICGKEISKEEIRQGSNKKDWYINLIIFMGKYIFCPLTLIVFILGVVFKGIG